MKIDDEQAHARIPRVLQHIRLLFVIPFPHPERDSSHVTKDSGVANDLARAQPEILAQVRARWSNWRSQMDAAEPRGPFRDY